ncbi:sigma-70 family rna polymerase sigma factor : RNA polymerase sigma factor, sigma-70 family OS=Singulisphaera acidiphila (strain ATCC BAA-1392 / DSM 18658 / VKM B-2454 / MOB10) GN=Sinac_4570 PE=4 SV=1: Sigma70_r2 [Gemmata massiliana]|uniref:RNA polymerase sigma-70 region 2 domain-containing protein n=2 Tax=Gemmata massiliana TaxID=1210884 RepID=A0A6P2CZX3_9BACT|nr:sigma-70 family rna polymerase sigma factor : RNA polymerase sigma factor, sigma-70 family OS=Singulisphaera acidiphila (strain ATCC BAA-1392 / DSM 18658 / VKM B-2454 / MOB10) GN=Sinac_4570 PE=4 SV=1: Sigma70_r2 [Gemmata massiliana]
MVWGVCRRVLTNREDAEDAFPATFLVLIRKPESVRPAARVGNWLHGVAVRAARAVSRRRERPVEPLPEPVTVAESIWHDVIPVLDQELARLPENFRLPVVLCDLEGKPRPGSAGPRARWPGGWHRGGPCSPAVARHGLPVSAVVLTAVLSGTDASAALLLPYSIPKSAQPWARRFIPVPPRSRKGFY